MIYNSLSKGHLGLDFYPAFNCFRTLRDSSVEIGRSKFDNSSGLSGDGLYLDKNLFMSLALLEEGSLDRVLGMLYTLEK